MGKAKLGEIALVRFTKKGSLEALTKNGMNRAVLDHSDWFHSCKYRYAVEIFEQNEAAAISGMWETYMMRLGVMESQGCNIAHFVFDGAPVAAKAPTDRERKAERAEAASLANALRATGERGSGYQKLCRKAVGRTPWLERALFRKLLGWNSPSRSMVVTAEVALGEADPQIINLLKLRLYDFAIVNDYDYTLYGYAGIFLYKLFYRQHGWKQYAAGEGDIIDMTTWVV